MKNTKRVATLVLSATMAFSVMSVSSFAAFDFSSAKDKAGSAITSVKDSEKVQNVKDKIENIDTDDILNEDIKDKADEILGNDSSKDFKDKVSDKADEILGNDSSKDFKNKVSDKADKIKTEGSAIKDKLEDILDENIEDEATPLAGGVSFVSKHIAYVNGYEDNTFRPSNGITRAEAATILYNLLDEDSHKKFDTSVNSFSDVKSGWYLTQVSTLANAGVIKGYTDNTFRPNDKVTRAEFVKMVVEIKGYVAGAVEPFTDVTTSDWYYDSAATAYTNDWVKGAALYNPNKAMSRAEVVTFLNRVLERESCEYAGSASAVSFSDVVSGDWYYGAVIEAANGHDTEDASAQELSTEEVIAGLVGQIKTDGFDKDAIKDAIAGQLK